MLKTIGKLLGYAALALVAFLAVCEVIIFMIVL